MVRLMGGGSSFLSEIALSGVSSLWRRVEISYLVICMTLLLLTQFLLLGQHEILKLKINGLKGDR